MIKHKSNLRLKRITLILASALYAGAVFAETTYAIQIPAQRLDLALQSLAQQSGTQILFVTKAVNNYQSETLNQELTVEQALQQLLKGKNLQIKKIADNKFSIVEGQPQARNMGQLKPIDVNIRGVANTSNTALQLPLITVNAEDHTSYAAKKVSIGKTEQSLKEIPQSVSVITQQQIEDQGFTTIADTLNQATGVVSYGYAGSENYQVRFAAANVQVNGIPQSNNISNEDPALYERIEVLRGPSGLLTGSGAPSGSINFVRKRPMQDNTGSIAVSAGSWGSYRSEFDANVQLTEDARLRGRFVGVYNHQGEFYDNAQDDAKTTAYGVVEYQLTDQATLGISATHIDEDYINYWGLPLDHNGHVPDKKYYVGYNRLSHREQNQYTIDFNYDFDNQWNAKIAYNQNKLQFTNYGAYATAPLDSAGLTSVAVGHVQQDYRHKNLDVNLTGPIHFFGQEHQLLLGYNQWESEYFGGARYNFASNWDVLNNHSYDSVVNTNILSKSNDITKQSGFYASAKIKLIAPLTLILGGRWSDYRQKSRTVAATTSAWRASAANTNNEFTPYAGLVWDINDQLTWYASYADSFVPQTEQTYQGKTLDPRIGWQIETGIKADFFNGALNTSMAVFQIRDKNRAMLDSEHIGCGGTTTGQCYKAAGEVQARGIEFEVSGKPTPNLNLTAGYTYNDLKYLSDNNVENIGKRFAADTIPKQLFKLWSVYSFDQQYFSGYLNHWHIGLGLQAQSSLYNTTMQRSGFTVFSTKIGYQINPNWQAALQINNVFDKTYLNNPGTTFYYNIYGEPRNFMLTLRAKY
ncbi:TonB-dependent siderophore receptor [Acinetobacter puyangensis]|uniref:TonB-dependent siderophore receptor n=1 Tax=Acinetobacter puyangensis TaxID=1096779 RepID=UPI003A4D7EA3